jgi:hypothetical protein
MYVIMFIYASHNSCHFTIDNYPWNRLHAEAHYVSLKLSCADSQFKETIRFIVSNLSAVAERSKARVYGRSLAGIAGSNPAVSMDVCLLSVFCVAR